MRATISIFTIVSLLCIATTGFGAPDIKLTLQRKAIVVGANYGGKDRATLKYAQSDARAFARVLSDLGGMEQKDIHLVMEPRPRQFIQAIHDIKKTLLQSRGKYRRLELIVYYSGHADEKGLLLGDRRLTYQNFKSAIKEVPADIRIAVLDACASGALTRMKGGKKRAAFLSDESSDMKGHAFLTSNTGDEAAQESDKIQGSYFTHVLVSGLRGAADITQDGRVTLNEAYQYAFHETLAKTEGTMAGPQHAGYDMQLSGTGEVVMTDLRGTSATLTMDTELDGRIYIRDKQGRLIVEVRKFKGRPIQLGLEPGIYKVVIEKEGPLFGADVTVSKNKETVLNKESLKPITLIQTVSRGGKKLPDSTSTHPDTNLSVNSPALPYDTIPISVSLFPDVTKKNGRLRLPRTLHYQSYNLFVGGYYKLDGFGLGLLSQWAVEDVNGVQVSLLLNYAGDTVRGAQASSFVNVCKNLIGAQLSSTMNLAINVEGWQAAGMGNIAYDVLGGQGAGFMNIAHNVTGGQGAGFANFGVDVSIGQGAGFMNLARNTPGQGAGFANVANDVHGQGAGFMNIANHVKGGQGAGFLNIANNVRGGQGAGFLNIANNVRGGQGAGFLNIAGHVHGAQGAGFLNIAGIVNGAQVSFINIADSVSGETVGILNLVGNGQYHPIVWMDESGVANLSLKTGTKHAYGLINIGALMFKDGRDLFITRGIGLGVQFPILFTEVFTDISYNRFTKPKDLADLSSNIILRQRVGINLLAASHLKLCVGFSLNMMRAFQETLDYQDYLPTEEINIDNQYLWKAWPGFFTGVEF